MPLGEPYDGARVGARVRLVGGTEARIVGVHKRERALLTGHLTPPLFDIVELETGMRVLIHGSVIEEVLDYDPDWIDAEEESATPRREPLNLLTALAQVRNERATIDAVQIGRAHV